MGLHFQVGDYQIRKLGCGWQLYRYVDGGLITKGKHKGIIAPAGWRAMEKYPNDLRYGVQLILNEFMARVDDDVKYQDIEKYIQKLDDYIESMYQKTQEGV